MKGFNWKGKYYAINLSLFFERTILRDKRKVQISCFEITICPLLKTKYC